MQGRRVYPNEEGDLVLAEGDYGIDPRSGHWMARPPGEHMGDLSNHEVVEHEDGTITVSPSILITAYSESAGEKTTWHGFLEHGTWREA